MYIPKRYGESKIEKCPFCSRQATTTSSEGVPVCISHKNSVLPELKCVCGKPVVAMTGKFGLYFHCMNCGNVNAKKIFEMNDIVDANPKKKTDTDDNKEKLEKRIITIRSDEVE